MLTSSCLGELRLLLEVPPSEGGGEGALSEAGGVQMCAMAIFQVHFHSVPRVDTAAPAPPPGEQMSACACVHPPSQVTFREHSGTIQVTFREHSGTIQGTFREHSGNIQAPFREHSGNIQGTFRAHSGYIQIESS